MKKPLSWKKEEKFVIKTLSFEISAASEDMSGLLGVIGTILSVNIMAYSKYQETK